MIHDYGTSARKQKTHSNKSIRERAESKELKNSRLLASDIGYLFGDRWIRSDIGSISNCFKINTRNQLGLLEDE